MKKSLCVLLLIFTHTTCGWAVTISTVNSDGLAPLRNEVAQLQKQLSQKQNRLNKCTEQNKNFQIAGGVTVGLGVAGVATNVALYSEMKGQQKQAQNMVNKIENYENQAIESAEELRNLTENIDYDKFEQELAKNMTPEERERFATLYSNSNSIDPEQLTNSDKQLFKKVFTAIRNSQK